MIQRVTGAGLGPAPQVHSPQKGQGGGFGALLQQELARSAQQQPAQSVAFSKHAISRAEERAQDAEKETERAIQEREQAAAETEKVRKELTASGNKAVVAFGEHFEAVQGHLGKLLSCLEELEQAGDRENHDKLSRAYQALMEQYGKGD